MHWGVHDQSIQEFEDQLFSKILLAQRQYDHVRAPTKELCESSTQQAALLQQLRGCDFSLPALFSGRGHGPFVELSDGSVKFDLIGGIGPYLLGHSHPLQIKANLKAARGCLLNSTNFLPANLSTQTAEILVKSATSSRLAHCWFSGSGSMANDSALRMLCLKRVPRKRLIAFEESFAGRTLTMQSLTDGDSSAAAIEIDYIPFPIDQASTSETLSALNSLLAQFPDQYIAFHGELLQGEGGVHIPYTKGLQQIFKLLKSQSIPIWIDEVQTFARTTQLFAFQSFDVASYVDVCTIGKAFNLSATLFTSEFALPQGLGGTFQGSVASLIYACDLVRLLTLGNFYGESSRVKKLEKCIRACFTELQSDYPSIIDGPARGIGTIWGLSLRNGSFENVQNFIRELYNNGILVWRAGRNKHCLRMLFPLTISDEHLAQIKKIFAQTLDRANYLES